MTTVPQQALFAINSTFMLARSDSIAKQLAMVEPAEQVKRLYATVLGREPTATEQSQCEQFLTAGTLQQLCQVLLMSNELMFVD